MTIQDSTNGVTISANTRIDTELDATVPLTIAYELYSDSAKTAEQVSAMTSEQKNAEDSINLQLATYSGGWQHKYLTAGTTDNASALSYTGETGLLDWKCYKFTVGYDISGVTATTGQTKAQTFDANHTSAESLRITVSKTLVGNPAAADSHNYGVFKVATAGADSWDGSSVSSLTNQELGATSASTYIFYVFVYCDGAAHVYNDNAPAANFTVSVDAASNNG